MGSGGFVGASLRYVVAGFVQRVDPAGSFPYGTVAVNVLGCLAIGLLSGLADSRQVIGVNARLVLMLGLLGGFTTYSTFAYETVALLRDGEQLRAALNVLVSVAACVGGAWLGYAAGARP